MGPTDVTLACIVSIPLMLAGCGSKVSGTNEEKPAGWIRIVEPLEGDSLAGWIDIVAEVDIGELVHRVTFFVDDAPIVVATTTPWATDWLPPAGQTGKVVRFRAEALGASGQVTSPSVSIWIAPRGTTGSRIVGPHRSVWAARTPDTFLELQRCGSDAWTEATRWTGDGLNDEFRSERLPVAMLPAGLQRVRAERLTERVDAWVHPFDYPGNKSPLAATESLALALRARDIGQLTSLLSPSARLDSCGDRIVASLNRHELSTALGRFLDDPEVVDLSWSWRLASLGEWSRNGRTFALVRANNLRWTVGRLSDPCGDGSIDWIESRPGGSELVWSRAEDGSWTLDRWTDHVSRDGPAFVDQLRPS